MIESAETDFTFFGKGIEDSCASKDTESPKHNKTTIYIMYLNPITSKYTGANIHKKVIKR